MVEACRNGWANYEARAVERKWSGFRKSLPANPNGAVMLHIGCGEINAPGFINIDARPQAHVHIVTSNLFKLKMMPANVADMIYMSHVLEHVSHRAIVTTLKEMHRILKPGGVLRVSVPDFDKIIEIYRMNESDVSSIVQALMGGQNYAFNYHYSIFNDAHLCNALLRSGFTEARSWDPQNCAHHDFDDWASRKISYREREFAISLNIEAVK